MKRNIWCLIATAALAVLLWPATAAPRPAKTGKVIVTLKSPATPPVVRELRQKLNVVKITPDQRMLLVLPKPGQTLAKIEKAHPKIAFADLEIVHELGPH